MNGELIERINSLIDLRRYEEATTAAQQALRSHPDEPELLCVYAIALSHSGQHAIAVESARRAVSLNPDDWFGYRVLGSVLGAAPGGLREGLKALAKARELNPHDPLVHLLIAERSLDLIPTGTPYDTSVARREILREARAASTEAKRLAPHDAANHLVDAKVLLAMKEIGAAEAAARHGLRLDPNNAVGHQILGVISSHRGDGGSAADHFVAAARVDPRSDTSLRFLRGVPGVWVAWAFAGFLALGLGNAALTGQIAVTPIRFVSVVIGLAVLVYMPYHLTRRSYSASAKNALRRDRALRFHRRRRRS